MVIERITQNQQRIADNLNPSDSVLPILKQHKESVDCHECGSTYFTETIGESWIVGSSTNGLVGTNTGTQSGSQQVVGGSGRGGLILISATNPNDEWKEFLEFSNYVDTSETSATVSVANQRITF